MNPLINSHQADFIVQATKFCLTHNNFTFDGEYYKQQQGTAMGANIAPLYVNLAMDFWEINHIHKNNQFAANIVFFGRYIDDLNIIWDVAPALITSFVQYCNNNTNGLSFTFVTNPSTMAFLDLELGHDVHNIFAKNYSKPTAGNSYLYFKN